MEDPAHTPEQRRAVDVVVLAFGDEPWLEACADAVLASRGIDVRLLLVDNGCSNRTLAEIAEREGITLVTPDHNLGFAGGCNEGARHATAPFLALVNSDAIVGPDALARLAATADAPDVGIATCSLRLADDPQQMNSAGNPVHVSGLTWAGSFGELASKHQMAVDVPTATGATCVMRLDLWRELGGFAPEYFAYLEDTELSLRCWQRGLRIVFVPDAVVVHHYEFSRTAMKFELLERNRHVLLLTLYEARTLVLLAPVLALVEAAMWALALQQGWAGSKVRAARWLLRNGSWVRTRRRQLQSERSVADGDLAWLFTTRLDATNIGVPAAARLLDLLVSGWWWLVRPLLRREA